MPNTSSEVVVAANGSIHVAPVGTALPDSLSDTLDPLFAEIGFVTQDGVTWTDGKTVTEHRAWQSRYPIRRTVDERSGMLAFQMLQWNTDTTILAFGGGAVTEPVVGEFRYTPPEPEELDERALVARWQDGDKSYQLIFPRGMVLENVETNLTASAMAALPITFGLLAEDDEPPYFFDTDDPAYEIGS